MNRSTQKKDLDLIVKFAEQIKGNEKLIALVEIVNGYDFLQCL